MFTVATMIIMGVVFMMIWGGLYHDSVPYRAIHGYIFGLALSLMWPYLVLAFIVYQLAHFNRRTMHNRPLRATVNGIVLFLGFIFLFIGPRFWL